MGQTLTVALHTLWVARRSTWARAIVWRWLLGTTPERSWCTAKGEWLLLELMSDNHLWNTLRMLRGRPMQALASTLFIGSGPDDFERELLRRMAIRAAALGASDAMFPELIKPS